MICQEEALKAAKLFEERKSMKEIKTAIDKEFGN
jgi:hypothetical protein